MSKEELESARKKADKAGISISDFARMAINHAQTPTIRHE